MNKYLEKIAAAMIDNPEFQKMVAIRDVIHDNKAPAPQTQGQSSEPRNLQEGRKRMAGRQRFSRPEMIDNPEFQKMVAIRDAVHERRSTPTVQSPAEPREPRNLQEGRQRMAGRQRFTRPLTKQEQLMQNPAFLSMKEQSSHSSYRPNFQMMTEEAAPAPTSAPQGSGIKPITREQGVERAKEILRQQKAAKAAAQPTYPLVPYQAPAQQPMHETRAAAQQTVHEGNAVPVNRAHAEENVVHGQPQSHALSVTNQATHSAESAGADTVSRMAQFLSKAKKPALALGALGLTGYALSGNKTDTNIVKEANDMTNRYLEKIAGMLQVAKERAGKALLPNLHGPMEEVDHALAHHYSSAHKHYTEAQALTKQHNHAYDTLGPDHPATKELRKRVDLHMAAHNAHDRAMTSISNNVPDSSMRLSALDNRGLMPSYDHDTATVLKKGR